MEASSIDPWEWQASRSNRRPRSRACPPCTTTTVVEKAWSVRHTLHGMEVMGNHSVETVHAPAAPPPECKVSTPSQLAEAIVRALEPGPMDRWLDPCVGSGAFVAALRAHGVPTVRISAVDIDPEASAEDRAAQTERGVDFFEWLSKPRARFSKIIANPPYVSIRRLPLSLQKTLTDAHDGDRASFKPSSNYWCAFLAASLGLLDSGGDLGFVLPAAWEYAEYAAHVRRAVMTRFRRVEIHRCLKPLFPTVQEGCIVLIARGFGENPLTIARRAYDSSDDLIAALLERSSTEAQMPETHASPAVSLRAPTQFGDLYSVRIGLVTGDADFFLLTETQRLKHNLPRRAMRPILSKARHLQAAWITRSEWTRLLRNDERCWLFSPSPALLKEPAVQRYIELGERACDLESYKLRHREPWYRVPLECKAQGFLSGMTKAGPWIAFNSMPGLRASNTLYVLERRNRMSLNEEGAWALSLLSSEARSHAASLGRRYPDGLVKYEPADLRRIVLPTPVRLAGAAAVYQRAVRCLADGNQQRATEIADRFVGGGSRRGELAARASPVCEVAERRKEKGM
jgi:adenine-specific DNA-methyltransferase